MIIKSLYIKGFGKHKELKLDVNPDLNIFYGPNEVGKSTVQAFIKAMLYGINHRARNISDNERLKYLPWDNSPMSGELIVENNGYIYSIKRTFGETKRQDKLEINNAITGEAIVLKNGEEPGEWLLDMTLPTFENTVFIRQLSPFIDSTKEKSSEILSKLSNLAGSGDEETSVKLVESRLKRAMDSLHSPRRDKGIIDRLNDKRNNLNEELNKYYSLKESTAEKLKYIEQLKKKKIELLKNMELLEKKKADLENSKTLSDWNEISELTEKKKEYSERLNELYCNITFSGEIIDRSRLEKMKNSIQKYGESLQTLSVMEKNYNEALETFLHLSQEAESKASFDNIDYSHLKKCSTDIVNLESIALQRNSLKDKINAIENDIKMEEAKYNQLISGKEPDNASSSAFYIILAILSTIIAAIGFMRPNIIFIFPGIIGILASLSILLYNKKKQISEKNFKDMKQRELSKSIESMKNTANIYRDQLDLLFRGYIPDINPDNLDDRINELKNYINNTLSAVNCSDLFTLDKELTAYKALILRLKDVKENLEIHKNRYLEAKKISDELQKEIFADFIIIGCNVDMDIAEIKNKLNEIDKHLDQIDTLKNKLEHLDDLISIKLGGRNIDDLKAKALRIDPGFKPCEYNDNIYEEAVEKLDLLNKELNEVSQDIIREQGIISSAFKGVRDEEELVPLINEVTEQIDEYEYYYSCLELARNVLNESFEEMQKSFGPVLNEETAGIFNYITDNRYGNVYINKDFNIMLNTGDNFNIKESSYLSMGAMDQLYFSLRVAIANLIGNREHPLPLFLDDTFVQYDEDRVRRVLDFIRRESLKRQIFMFTCHERIINYLMDNFEDKYIFIKKIINL